MDTATGENRFAQSCQWAAQQWAAHPIPGTTEPARPDTPSVTFHLRCGTETCIVKHPGPGPSPGPALAVSISGTVEQWGPVLDGLPGGLHRAWRRDLLTFEGDIAQIIPFWNLVWELGRMLQSPKSANIATSRPGTLHIASLPSSPPSDAPAVILLHGAGQDHHVWDDLLATPLPGYRMLAPDLPGHGANTLPACSDYAGLSRWLARFCEDARLSAPPILIGHSFAGYLALHHAVSGFPCRGVVIVNSTAMAKGAWTSEKLSLIECDPAAWFAVHFRAGCSPRTLPERIDHLVAETYRTLKPDVMMADMHMFGQADLRDDLGRLSHPLRVIHGLDDWSLPPDLGRALAQTGNGQFEGIENAGHFPHIEQPEIFRLALLRALDGM